MKCFYIMGALLGAALFLAGCGDNAPPSLPPAPSSSSTPTGSGSSHSGAQSNNAAASQNQGQFVSNEAENFWYILLDNSGSMGGGRMREAKKAIRKFLESEAARGKIFALAVFGGGGAKEWIPFRSDARELIIQNLDKIDTGGGTPLGPAIDDCSAKIKEQMNLQYGHGLFNLLVVTDGEADMQPMLDAVKRLEQVREYEATIGLYTIGFALSATHSLASYSVKYLEANDASTLVKAMTEATTPELGDLDSLLGDK